LKTDLLDNFPAVAAIDPGASGGVAILAKADAGASIQLHPIPADPAELSDLIPFGAIIFIEKVPPFVGRIIPSSAAFKLGKSCGWLEGWAAGRQHRVILVSPQTWQAGLGIAKGKLMQGQWKSALKAEASRRYPDLSGLTLKTADALLILDYALNYSPRN
jgi:hypothetical protein